MIIQVNVSEEMVKKIDSYAKSIGVSRSSLCATIIGQGIMAYDKYDEFIDGMKSKISTELLTSK